ncbi:MAG: hypothetical protein H0X28_12510 [Solirubrobacterales bacterium]|nr:hypothetical protein [Solirubrobacterales bacterium]
MYARRRRLPLIAVPLLVVVAVAGYMVGYRHAPASTAVTLEKTSRIVSGADVLLEFPSSWQRTRAPVAIPGLALARELALVAAGTHEQAGLISGQLTAGEPSPLPASFRKVLLGVPKTELLDFLGGQAYRYSGLQISGYPAGQALNLYVIPNPGNGPTAIGCYAPKRYVAILSECEQIVAKLTLVGQSQFDLTPDAGYAKQLGAAIHTLDSERLALRRRIHESKRPTQLGVLATTLAAKFAAAAAGLSPLEPPIAAGAAQAALGSSLLAAESAYRALSHRASEAGESSYVAQLARVERAEMGVDEGLESFALLGYGRS